MEEKRIKKWPYVILAIVLIVGALGIYGYNAMANPENIAVGSVDISQVPNGVYTGEAKNGFVKAKVSVVVADGTITSIDILNHRTGKGKPAEAITQDVINAQSLEVDAISSATISSKTILQAIENALAGQ